MNDVECEGYIHPGPLRKDEFKGNGFMAKTSFSCVVTIFAASTARCILENAPARQEIAIITGNDQVARTQAPGGHIEDVMDAGLEEAFVAQVHPESGGQP